MTWHSTVLTGLAEQIAGAGLGVYREDGQYAEAERGIVMQAYPERPVELISLSLYLPERTLLSPTAKHDLSTPRVQIRYRLLGHPFGGIDMFDGLSAVIDGKHLTLGDAVATGEYVSFASLGQDASARHEFSTNWKLTGLRPL